MLLKLYASGQVQRSLQLQIENRGNWYLQLMFKKQQKLEENKSSSPEPSHHQMRRGCVATVSVNGSLSHGYLKPLQILNLEMKRSVLESSVRGDSMWLPPHPPRDLSSPRHDPPWKLRDPARRESSWAPMAILCYFASLVLHLL